MNTAKPTMTPAKLADVTALAPIGMGVRYIPTRDGFQIGFGEPGHPACHALYTSWNKPVRRCEGRDAAGVTLARRVREIVEA